MKTFKTIFLGAALIFGLGACNNGDAIENIDTTETKTVMVKLSFDAPETYAESNKIDFTTSGTTNVIAFTAGHLYFADAVGNVVKYEEITAVSAYTTGKELQVPITATQVYVIGNCAAADATSNLPITATSTLDAIKASVVKLEDQVTNVLLTGEGSIDATARTVAVPMKTPMARIELHKLTADGTTVASFKVKGVFIDGYYPTAKIDGTPTGTYVQSTGEGDRTAADFSDDSGKPYASYIPSKAVVDWYGTATPSTAASVVTAPTSSSVWAYNLFVNESKAEPVIVVRLTEVTLVGAGTAIPQDLFLTIKGLKLASGGAEVNNLAAGNVYAIENVSFGSVNLGSVPYATTTPATVTISPAVWTEVKVEPIL